MMSLSKEKNPYWKSYSILSYLVVHVSTKSTQDAFFEGERKQNFLLQTVKGRAKRRLREGVQLQKNISCVCFFQYTTILYYPPFVVYVQY